MIEWIATEPRPPPDHPTGPWTPRGGAGSLCRVRVAIIGAGPTGLFLGAALQRRGHAVTVVDRDGGPEPDGSWPRKGVMQFHHAHAFRGPGRRRAAAASCPRRTRAGSSSGPSR